MFTDEFKKSLDEYISLNYVENTKRTADYVSGCGCYKGRRQDLLQEGELYSQSADGRGRRIVSRYALFKNRYERYDRR